MPAAAQLSPAIRAAALFEAIKGFVVLLAASGLTLVHKDLHALASGLIEHFHLNPASHYPTIFLDAIANLTDRRLLLLAAGAAIYSLVRFIEAYGLYYEMAWAEILAAGSGAVYIPFEVINLATHPSWHSALLLAMNIAIVSIVLTALILKSRTP